MGGYLEERRSLSRVSVETAGKEVPALGRQRVVLPPLREPQQDLTVRLEGNVPTDHVVQEDPQRPHSQPVSCVASVLYPLWRGIDPGPWNINVNILVSWTLGQHHVLEHDCLHENVNCFYSSLRTSVTY